MNKILKKFLEFAMGNILVFILGIITLPIITRIITPVEYGKSAMFNTMSNLFLFITMLGVDQAFVRYVYEEDEENRNSILGKCLRIAILTNFFISIVSVIFYKSLSNLISGKSNIQVVLLLIGYNAVNILNRFGLLYIRMKQESKKYSMVQVIGQLAYLVLIYIVYKIFGDNYITLVIATLFSTIVTILYMRYIVKVDLSIFSRKETRATSRQLLTYGIPVAFATAITWLLNSTDRIILSKYFGYSEIGIYSGAFTIIGMLNLLQGVFNTFWVPIANDKYVNDVNAKDFYILMNKIVASSMIIISILMIMFRDVITIILGSNYQQAIYVFPFLVFIPLMNTVSETTVIGINFLKKTKYHILIGVIALVVNIIGNLLLVPMYGAKGAAFSTGMSYIIFYIFRTSISKKLYYVEYKNFRFILSTVFLIIFALYATFNKTNLILIALGILCIIICIISYRDVYSILWQQVSKKLFTSTPDTQ